MTPSAPPSSAPLQAMFWGMTILSAGFVLLGPCPLLVSVLGSSMSSLFIALVMIGARARCAVLLLSRCAPRLAVRRCVCGMPGPPEKEGAGGMTITNRCLSAGPMCPARGGSN